MAKSGYIGVKVDPDLIETINDTARKDYRKQSDQIRYLIDLGLRYRESLNANIERTQIEMPTTDEEREAALGRIR